MLFFNEIWAETNPFRKSYTHEGEENYSRWYGGTRTIVDEIEGTDELMKDNAINKLNLEIC